MPIEALYSNPRQNAYDLWALPYIHLDVLGCLASCNGDYKHPSPPLTLAGRNESYRVSTDSAHLLCRSHTNLLEFGCEGEGRVKNRISSSSIAAGTHPEV